MQHFVFCKDQIIVPEALDIISQVGSSGPDILKLDSPHVTIPQLANPKLAWEEIPANVTSDELERAHKVHFRFENEERCVLSLEAGKEGYFGGLPHLKVRELIGILDPKAMALLVTAMAYANWSLVSSYCGACGSPLREGEGDERLAKVCNHCGRVFFPRLSPAVITLIHKEDRILLAHNLSFPDGRYGLIAGFVELGETFEQTVHREVMEEAGIEIYEPRYIRSQPWPFPDSLMVAFEADWKAGKPRPDGKEIGAVGWFGLDELPNIPLPGSVARYLIDRAVEQSGRTK